MRHTNLHQRQREVIALDIRGGGQREGRYEGLLLKLQRFATLAPEARAAVERWPSSQRRVDKGRSIGRDPGEGDQCRLLLSGVAARHRVTVEGKQQILSFLHPGDLIDLQHYFGREDLSEIVAVSAVTVVAVPRASIRQTAHDHPTVAAALEADVLIEAAIGREWLLNIGQRDARARVAHLLSEVAVRLAATGYGDADRFEFPMTQNHVASATGLTSVHVNRTLRKLTEDGLISYGTQHVTIRDVTRLRKIGDFDPRYLRDLTAAG